MESSRSGCVPADRIPPEPGKLRHLIGDVVRSPGTNVRISGGIVLSVKRGVVWISVVLVGCGLASCIWISQSVRVQPVAPLDGTVVSTPVKAHLEDGSTVVYTEGVTVADNALHGVGEKYNPALTDSEPVSLISLDEVVAMESFSTDVGVGESVLISSLATAGTVVAASAVVLALFGSCPTVYSGDGTVEEAELFSSSIAPLFEARDLDRLKAQPDQDDVVTLEVRNEAMETHYINNLQLIEVAHDPDEFVLPDPGGRPVRVSSASVVPIGAVRDRTGRDVAGVLASSDGNAYSTDATVVETASAADLSDWMDFSVPVPPGSPEVALVFRLRNSLMGTVLLYNVMLEPMGAGALDWIGSGLDEIATAVELGRWLEDRAGLHVSVRRDGSWSEVARVPDSGPISWHDVAVRVPVRPGESRLELRVSFMADHWRIDRMWVASGVRDAAPRIIPLSAVTDRDGIPDYAALERLGRTDTEYLETRPGQRFFARFSVGEAPDGRPRTFLLSSLGYYIEWIRGDWIRGAPVRGTFEPADATLVEALGRWDEVRDQFEERFRRERVPVDRN